MYVTLIMCTPLLFLFYPLTLHVSIPTHARIIKLNYIWHLTSIFIYFKCKILATRTNRKETLKHSSRFVFFSQAHSPCCLTLSTLPFHLICYSSPSQAAQSIHISTQLLLPPQHSSMFYRTRKSQTSHAVQFTLFWAALIFTLKLQRGKTPHS